MKFACVELYTRTDGVWDISMPDNNVDTTSFAGWTRAFNGRHIPLTWLAQDGKQRNLYHKYMAPLVRKLNGHAFTVLSKKLTATATKFPNMKMLDGYDAVLFITHDYSLEAMANAVHACRRLPNCPAILGAFGVPFAVIRSAIMEKAAYLALAKFLDGCDRFINCNHPSVARYLSLVSDVKTVDFSQFYPFEYAKKFYKTRRKKSKLIFISGSTQRSDHVLSMLVAKKIQESHREFLIEYLNHPKINHYPLAEASAAALPLTEWTRYLEQVANCFMVIDMDSTFTVGRVPRDAAAVGTPCIGINSEGQHSLFPALECPDLGIEKAVSLGTRLINDGGFYERMQHKAFKGIERCSFKNSAKRMTKIIEGVKR